MSDKDKEYRPHPRNENQQGPPDAKRLTRAAAAALMEETPQKIGERELEIIRREARLDHREEELNERVEVIARREEQLANRDIRVQEELEIQHRQIEEEREQLEIEREEVRRARLRLQDEHEQVRRRLEMEGQLNANQGPPPPAAGGNGNGQPNGNLGDQVPPPNPDGNPQDGAPQDGDPNAGVIPPAGGAPPAVPPAGGAPQVVPQAGVIPPAGGAPPVVPPAGLVPPPPAQQPGAAPQPGAPPVQPAAPQVVPPVPQGQPAPQAVQPAPAQAPAPNAALQQLQQILQGLAPGEADRFLRQNNLGTNNAIRPTAREPPIFHGTNDENFERFTREVERFAAAVGWNDQQVARNVPFMFKGRALQVYDTVPDNVKQSWALLLTHLQNVHPFMRNRQAYAFDSLNRMQNEGESVAAYTHDMLNIFADARIQDEDMKVWIYKKGLLPTYRPYVLLQDARTLQDAERDALKAERAMKSGQLGGATQGLQVNYLFHKAPPTNAGVVPMQTTASSPAPSEQTQMLVNQLTKKVEQLEEKLAKAQEKTTGAKKKPSNPPYQTTPQTRSNRPRTDPPPPPVVNYHFSQPQTPQVPQATRPPRMMSPTNPTYYSQPRRFQGPRQRLPIETANTNTQSSFQRYCKQCQQRHPEGQHINNSCFTCGETGHFKRDCPHNGSEN